MNLIAILAIYALLGAIVPSLLCWIDVKITKKPQQISLGSLAAMGLVWPIVVVLFIVVFCDYYKDKEINFK